MTHIDYASVLADAEMDAYAAQEECVPVPPTSEPTVEMIREMYHEAGPGYATSKADEIINTVEGGAFEENEWVDSSGKVRTDDIIGGPVDFTYDEVGNAHRLVAKCDNNVRYCNESRTWYRWDDSRWMVVDSTAISQIGLHVLDELKDVITDGGMGKKHAQFVTKSRSKSGLNNMVALTSVMPGIGVASSQLDSDSQMSKLNTIGTTLVLDGTKLEQYPPNREDRITKVTGCPYDPDARYSLWVKFVHDIFGGDVELIRYVQKAVGYSLTGSIGEKCFFFCYGDLGDNGKTTFLNVIRTMMGDYGAAAAIRTFLKKRNGSDIRDDLVRLKGIRFVTAVEPNASATFDMEVLKPITGKDPITCRSLYQATISYIPQLKLWIAGNNRPLITEKNAAAWERLCVIPFTVSFRDRIDRGLEDKLKTELSGILNWALEGYKMYVEEGLEAPSCVRRANEEYKMSCNPLLVFIAEHCVRKQTAHVRTTEFHQKYRKYCTDTEQNGMSARKVRTNMSSEGIVVERNTQGHEEYIGIAVKDGAGIEGEW